MVSNKQMNNNMFEVIVGFNTFEQVVAQSLAWQNLIAILIDNLKNCILYSGSVICMFVISRDKNENQSSAGIHR